MQRVNYRFTRIFGTREFWETYTPAGTSWIYGLNNIVLENDDPFIEGFTVGDTCA